jgi:hypothetical protein
VGQPTRGAVDVVESALRVAWNDRVGSLSAMRWLGEGSAEAVAGVLRVIAPELGESPIVVRASVGEDDPLWWSASVVVATRFTALGPNP